MADVSNVDALHALELLLAALGGALFAVLGIRQGGRPGPDPTAVVDRPDLTAEVERRLTCATPERPLLVAVLDLDDFHGYAELFGPAAGDALLARLGAALVRAVGGRGGVHRTGPAEFSIVVPIGDEGPDRVLALATAALFEEGQGFSVGCSQGSVLLPGEADGAAEGLRLAGERLRKDRMARRAARRGQAGDALAAALRDRDESQVEQRRELADLAEDTARKLGVPADEVEQIRIAAGLHDVGKMAIPERILDKAGPLDEEEWAFLRRHTAIGERIVAAAPDLAGAAAIVRSIPERWDGRGYPDGLAGTRIALGARIVAVCSAYDAMTTTRPHRRAMPVPSALAELRRFAGVQFDPDVVEAFCLALLDHPVEH